MGKPYGMLTIVKCLDKDNKPLGRPVDCTEAPDGSILFADDAAGVVYRISYTGAKK
jgi:glucose/arabinose dehydrogenase